MSIISEYFVQGETENTCAFVALVNALVYYKKPIPSKRKLKSLIDKYEIQYGASIQDIYCIASELKLNLNPFKIKKDNFIKLLKSNMPILMSCYMRVGTNVIANNNNYKELSFNLKQQFITNYDKSLKPTHTTLVTDVNNGKFDVKNVIHNHMTLDFESFEFEKCENEYWDNCYFVTPTPIKKIYVNNHL